MKNYLSNLNRIGILLSLLLCALFTYAQTPRNVPKPQDNEPLTLNDPAEIIIYVAIPVAAIILYFVLKRKRKRDQGRNN